MTDNKNELKDNVSISEAYEKFWERIFKYISELKGGNDEMS